MAVWVLSGCANVLELDNARAVTPYELDATERVVIDVRVNGQGPYRFLLDTGASITVIFDRLRHKLGLQTIPDSEIVVQGIASTGKFSLLAIEQLSVGSEVWQDPRVVLLPNTSAASTDLDGVLGVDFLSRYAIGLRVRERALRLYPPELVAQRTYRGWSSVPLRKETVGGSDVTAYFIDIDIGGRELPAAFDLGAGVNMINLPGAKALGLRRTRSARDDEVTGVVRSMPAVARFAASQVTTANIRWRNEEFLVADLEIFKAFRLHDRPGAILGAGFFTQRDFIIDFVRERLLVNVSMDEIEPPRDSETGE